MFNVSELKEGNTTLYAKWTVNTYIITFIVDGEEYNKTTQEFGSNIIYPKNPTKEGFTFDGWNDTTITTVPAYNVVIEAKWIVNKYTITFIVDETRNETTQEFGSNIIYPKNPTKEGFTFDGWNDTITTVPAHNVAIEAKWIVNKYTITFIVDGEEYNKTTQEFGSNISFPENPTKEGFTFDGWYMDSAFKNKAENNNMRVNGTTTLYGQFISTTIRIEFSTKDMSTEEAIRKIEEFTGCTDCFTISKIGDEGGKAFIIVKFEDVSEAKNFVEIIKE